MSRITANSFNHVYDVLNFALDMGQTPDMILGYNTAIANKWNSDFGRPVVQNIFHRLLDGAIREKPLADIDLSGCDLQTDSIATLFGTGYRALRGAILMRIDPQSVATLPANLLRYYANFIRTYNLLGEFRSEIGLCVVECDIPDELVSFHQDRLDSLINAVVNDPIAFNAAHRLLSVKNSRSPMAQLEKDIEVLHDITAAVLHVINPTLVFNMKAEDKRGDSHLERPSIAERKNKGWHYRFRNNLWTQTPKGNRYKDADILGTDLHELAHSFEDMIVERLLGHINDLIDDHQKPHFDQTDLDNWSLKKAAVLMALNSNELGEYFAPENSIVIYDQQLRERHANWFSEQASNALKHCVDEYGLWLEAMNTGDNIADFLATQLLHLVESTDEYAMSRNRLPLMADLDERSLATLNLPELAYTLRNLDTAAPDCLEALDIVVTELKTRIKAGSLWCTVGGGNQKTFDALEWGLSLMVKPIASALHVAQTQAAGEKLTWPHFTAPQPALAKASMPAKVSILTPSS